MLLPDQKAFACSPAPPDPWFATKLSFDQSTLPSGIEIVQTHPTYEPYALINKSSEPFYLVRENLTDWKTFPNSELPKNYEPRYKITANQVYFWGQLSSQDTEGWEPNSGGINNSAATRVSIGEDIYVLEGESKQIYQDSRPAIVDVPDAQNFKIPGFYRGHPVELKGTVSYSLNEKYDPQRLANGVKACNDWDRRGIVFVLLPLLILVSFVGLFAFVVHKVIKAVKSGRKN